MSKTTLLQNLFHLNKSSAKPEQEALPLQRTTDRLTNELAGQELEARFRDALALGEISGDCVKLDENGNEIKDAFPTKTIFDF